MFILAAEQYNWHVLAFLYPSDSEDDDGPLEEIDFQLSHDYLLGAVVLNQSALLFTFKNGFVSLHCNQSDSK